MNFKKKFLNKTVKLTQLEKTGSRGNFLFCREILNLNSIKGYQVFRNFCCSIVQIAFCSIVQIAFHCLLFDSAF